MWQYDLLDYKIYRVSSQVFPEVQMLVRIYEVQLNYKIIYFDIDITISYILLWYVVNILYFIVTYL